MTNEYLNILVKVDKETGELTVIKQQLTDLDETAQSSTKSTTGLTSAFGGLKSILQIVSFAKLYSELKSAIAAGEEETEGIRKLTFALQANSISVDDNLKLLLQQAKYVQEVSRVSDDQYLSSITKSLNMTGNLSTAIRVTNASMGISLKTNIDASTAVMYLTQALNGQESGLTRLARSGLAAYIDKSKSAHENASILIGKFEKQYKDTDSLTGVTKQLSNRLDDVKESLGQAFAPSVIASIKLFTDTLKPTLMALLTFKAMNEDKEIGNIKERYTVIQEKIRIKQEAINNETEKYNRLMEKNKTASDMYSDQDIKNSRDRIISLNSEINVLENKGDYELQQHKEWKKSYKATADAAKALNAGISSDNEKLLTDTELKTSQYTELQRIKNEKMLEMERNYQTQIDAMGTDAEIVKRAALQNQIDDDRKALYEISTERKNATKTDTDAWVKALDTEAKAYKNKSGKIVTLTKEEIAAIKKLREKENKETAKTEKEIMTVKIDNATSMFGITKNFLEAGLILAGEDFKKRKSWSIAMIVLEKSIAIMKAISAAAGKGPLAWAIAAGEIALITAQGIAQVKAINKASDTADSETSSSDMSSSNPLQTEQSGTKIGGQAFNGVSTVGSESGRNIVNVQFNVIDPTSLTTEAQEKMARWLKNVLDNENKR